MAPTNRRTLLLCHLNLLLLAAKLVERRRQHAKKHVPHRFRINSFNQDRMTQGAYFSTYKRLREYPDEFYEYLRMSIAIFDFLLSLVEERISKRTGGPFISAEERLVLTLRYLATGESYQSLAIQFRLGASTIKRIVPECCSALWDVLQPRYLRCLTTVDEWQAISQKLWEKTQFPNCCGCIDGKRVVIKKPKKSASKFRNYKGTFSTVLMALCDAQCRFLYIDVGSYGRSHDASIFRSSELCKKLEKGELNLPPKSVLPGSQLSTPYVILGDRAFPLRTYLMKPIQGRHWSDAERIYNSRLSRCRVLIEIAFGICATMWCLFKKPIETSVEDATKSIKATCYLHNVLIAKESVVSLI